MFFLVRDARTKLVLFLTVRTQIAGGLSVHLLTLFE
jgi:hypothetical protein